MIKTKIKCSDNAYLTTRVVGLRVTATVPQLAYQRPSHFVGTEFFHNAATNQALSLGCRDEVFNWTIVVTAIGP